MKNKSDFEKKANLLRKNIDRSCVKSMSGFGNTKVLYLEGWQAIEIANDIFGYNGWSSNIYDMKEEYREVREYRGCKIYNVAYTCMCRVILDNGVYHEDIGFGSGEGLKHLGKAIEKAKKGAVTDALKRSLRQFGNGLGNCCYNKDFINGIDNPDKREKYRNGERTTVDEESFILDAEILETDDS